MNTFLDPAILFFLIGVGAGLLKSNLEIPPAISRFLSLYLLMALGLKGGFALSHSGFPPDVVRALGAAVALAIAIPLAGYALLRRLLPPYDAAAVAATYGSVSAVTFITAGNYLESRGMAPGGHMAAAMALMESPAIVMAVLLANAVRQHAAAPATYLLEDGTAVAVPTPRALPVGKVVRESFTDGGQVLLLGAMAVGMITGDAGKAAMQPFSADLFKGMLAFFLLDMGLLAARHLDAAAGKSPWLIAYASLGPLVHACIALALAFALELPKVDAAILMVLAASASYIAVPAALRYAIPEANPSLYVGLSLGITFPLNVLFGIPLYAAIATYF